MVRVATSISASRHHFSPAGMTHSESVSHMSVFSLHLIQSLPSVVVVVVEVVVVVVVVVVVSSASQV